MKITKETYDLFCKYGRELLWVSDPIREPRPKGTSDETDADFLVLETLDENMELFYNDNYGDILKKKYRDQIEGIRNKVSDEVFRLIENKYKK